MTWSVQEADKNSLPLHKQNRQFIIERMSRCTAAHKISFAESWFICAGEVPQLKDSDAHHLRINELPKF